VRWAASELAASLAERRIACEIRKSESEAPAQDLLLIGSKLDSKTPESLSLQVGRTAAGREAFHAKGADPRGLVYALLEFADRVRTTPPATNTLGHAFVLTRGGVNESPANTIRSVTRLFCSDVEDKDWFNDRQMWPQYLTMLATQRFNRFNLSFGIGYDFLREVSDAYFLFLYPFLLDVPGYRVRVPQISDAERDRNLEMLRFISEQTVARGMQFQLGIWTHGYQWINSPNPNQIIEGLTKENHAAYCRDAVRLLLQKLPAVSGVTFRVHGESGVEEGSYDFWKTVFEGVKTCGRKVELDMHSKGMDQTMLDLGVSTGLPLKISPKFWAEHMGLPYHQADIRPVEYPRTDGSSGALMKFSAGSRNFTRYGYADLLREDRKWGVLHRIWPGTQRVLLWGDPEFAAAYSKAFSFSGSDGVEIMEPLSFKGRRGSGLAGDRCGYADRTLRVRWDWQKYLYTYRVWGRNLYNPNANHQSNNPAEKALNHASRILPLVTTAHCPSAANNVYWPEMYTNQPLIDGSPTPYTDTPAPRVFGNVSPLDPQLFDRINDFADRLLEGKTTGKYSPVEVATWLEQNASTAASLLQQVNATNADTRRLQNDVAIQIGLGRFFAAKFRAGVLYRIFEKTSSREALESAVDQYRAARKHWGELSDVAGKIYVPDVTIGERTFLRGHWLDRIPAIDADIASIERRMLDAKASDDKVLRAIQAALTQKPNRHNQRPIHVPPTSFKKATPLRIEAKFGGSAIRLYYRHVTQAERFESVAMTKQAETFHANIPASYLDGQYPIQYYFEVEQQPGSVALYPGLGLQLTGQPYFVVRRGA
jgi:hypothetical protein